MNQQLCWEFNKGAIVLPHNGGERSIRGKSILKFGDRKRY